MSLELANVSEGLDGVEAGREPLKEGSMPLEDLPWNLVRGTDTGGSILTNILSLST